MSHPSSPSSPRKPLRTASASARQVRDRHAPERKRPSLPADGLAYQLLEAARLIAAVKSGHNLTDCWQTLLRTHPDWPDATRGAVRDLSWGCLRDYARGRVVLQHLMKQPLDEPMQSVLEVALHRLEQRPEKSHLIVDQTVEAVASVAPGLRGVANAVLRNVLRQDAQVQAWREGDEEARWRHPAWWIAKVRRSRPTDWPDVLEAGNQHPPMSLRVNLCRASTDQVMAALAGEGIVARKLGAETLQLSRPCAVERLPGFAQGWLSVQDAGAQWAARWLDAGAGERVLDACAAPGGKSAHILERAAVALTALEVDPQRAGRIDDNLRRLGLQARVLVGDARDPQAWWDGQPFDRILADVPCSASGVARRHPDIKHLRRPQDIARFARQQAEILDALWPLLARGGTLLYATCSIFDEENRQQIAGFCARHPDACRLPIEGELDHVLPPTADHDGFYYALLRKPD